MKLPFQSPSDRMRPSRGLVDLSDVGDADPRNRKSGIGSVSQSDAQIENPRTLAICAGSESDRAQPGGSEPAQLDKAHRLENGRKREQHLASDNGLHSHPPSRSVKSRAHMPTTKALVSPPASRNHPRRRRAPTVARRERTVPEAYSAGLSCSHPSPGSMLGSGSACSLAGFVARCV